MLWKQVGYRVKQVLNVGAYQSHLVYTYLHLQIVNLQTLHLGNYHTCSSKQHWFSAWSNPSCSNHFHSPYHMTKIGFRQLKLIWDELLQNKSIWLRVYPCSALVLFANKNNGTLGWCTNYNKLNKAIIQKQIPIIPNRGFSWIIVRSISLF